MLARTFGWDVAMDIWATHCPHMAYQNMKMERDFIWSSYGNASFRPSYRKKGAIWFGQVLAESWLSPGWVLAESWLSSGWVLAESCLSPGTTIAQKHRKTCGPDQAHPRVCLPEDFNIWARCQPKSICYQGGVLGKKYVTAMCKIWILFDAINPKIYCFSPRSGMSVLFTLTSQRQYNLS